MCSNFSVFGLSIIIWVGYQLPFQHNELGHLPYMAVAQIPRGSSPDPSEMSMSQSRRAVPIVEVYPYSITNTMFLLTNSLSLVNTLPVNITIFLTYRGLSYYYYYLCSLTRTQQYESLYFCEYYNCLQVRKQTNSIIIQNWLVWNLVHFSQISIIFLYPLCVG